MTPLSPGGSGPAASNRPISIKDDQRPDFVAVADDLLRGAGNINLALVRLVAAAPGLAEAGDPADADILAATAS